MTENRFCAECGSPLDEAGACPNGHVQAAPQAPEYAQPAPPAPPAPQAPQYAQPAPPAPPAPQAPQYAPPQYAQPQYAQPVYSPPRPPLATSDKWAIAAFILAIITLLLYCVSIATLGFGTVCTGPVQFITLILSVIFGFLGLKGPKFKWMAITALVLGILQILAVIVGTVVLIATGGLATMLESIQEGSSSFPTY